MKPTVPSKWCCPMMVPASAAAFAGARAASASRVERQSSQMMGHFTMTLAALRDRARRHHRPSRPLRLLRSQRPRRTRHVSSRKCAARRVCLCAGHTGLGMVWDGAGPCAAAAGVRGLDITGLRHARGVFSTGPPLRLSASEGKPNGPACEGWRSSILPLRTSGYTTASLTRCRVGQHRSLAPRAG